MQSTNFNSERAMRAKASVQPGEERTILRIDREALKSDVPKVRFATQS